MNPRGGPAARPSTARTTVVVPVGVLEGAKSRLGDVLDPEERVALVLRLLDRTLTAAAGARSVREIVVISPDPTVLRRARRRGTRAVEQRGDGLNAGIAEALRAVPERDRMLVLPGDLPRVTAAAVDAMSAAADRAGAPVIVLVPDRHGEGTNALLLDPARLVAPAFGPGSRAAHRAAAEAAGAAYLELDGPLALDIDTPEDLLAAESEAPDALGVG